MTSYKRIAEEESGESIVVISPFTTEENAFCKAVHGHARRSDQLVVGDPE